MKSTAVAIGDQAKASQYNDLRIDASGGAFLVPHAKATPNMTVYVEAGTYYINGTKYTFAGGYSPVVTAPVSDNRIDVLTIDTAGVLAWTTGTPAASPTAPAYPASKIPICEIYVRSTSTTITDTDGGAATGYIRQDVRPMMYLPPSAFGLDNGTITYNDDGSVATVVDSNTSVTYTFAYDAATGYLTSVTDGTSTWTFTYNGAGQITAVAKT